ncbi:hypothetical protein B0H10DRAFT_1937862 [Mycena sp. CBHHK59/15]|nr:hypothetical protein B0H10DRAFT_1937862 [Mycena sp. CBHHK59/15]
MSVNLDAPPANSDTDLTLSQLGERIRNLAHAAAALLPAKVTGMQTLISCQMQRPTQRQGSNTQRTMISLTILPPDSLAPKPTTEADNQDSSSDIEIISADVPMVLAEGPSEMAVVPVEEVFYILFLNFQVFLTRYPSETETGLIMIDTADEPAAELLPENPAPSRLETPVCEVEMTSAQTSEPPTVAAARSERPTTVINPAAPAIPLSESKTVHAKLKYLIEKHIRLYRKPKTMVTDTTAANRIFDLEALHRFNNQ